MRQVAWMAGVAMVVVGAPAVGQQADYTDPIQRTMLRERAIASLLEASQDENAMLRANAIEGLQHAPSRIEEPLRRGLADVNEGVRYVAAMTAGELGVKSVLPEVEPLLVDAAPEVRAAAIFAMRKNGAEVDPTPLATMLMGDEARLRSQAAFVLGELGDGSAIPMLRSVVGTAPETGLAVEQRLARLQIAEALVKLGRDDAVHAIRAALYPYNPDEVEAAALAAQILGELRDRNAVSVLIQKIEERVTPGGEWLMPPEVRLAAARALGQMGYTDGRYVADEHASSPEPALRSQAAFVYAETVGEESLGQLAAMIDDPNPMVEVAASAATLRALERLDGGR